MANEISISLSIRVSKGGAKDSRSESFQVDMSGDAFTHEIQQVGTSEEELAQGADLGTPGFILVKNLDSTNYVEVGSTTGVYDIKLKAGEAAIYRHNSATVYAKANTAACNVEYILIED
jgi:hypothetical protein